MTVVGPVEVAVAGPFFEDLAVGDVFDEAPALTLTDGHAAVHQAVVGDRLRMSLDAGLSRAVARGPIAHPALVCDVAIGQSTLATQRVVANLFYRGLVLRRAPAIGDTLYTRTEVVALRRNRSRPTGLAVLRVTTTDQRERTVLDFWRCAMLPVGDAQAALDRDDDLDAIPAALPEAPELATAMAEWSLAAFRRRVPGAHFEALEPGLRWRVEGGDVVTGAPELARLSLNLATVHHDAGATGTGRRLVYGGHTIGIACSHVTRALPNLVYVVAWRGCDHLGPVFEGDVLRSTITLEGTEPLPQGGLVELRCEVSAHRDGAVHEVLDWRLVGVMA